MIKIQSNIYDRTMSLEILIMAVLILTRVGVVMVVVVLQDGARRRERDARTLLAPYQCMIMKDQKGLNAIKIWIDNRGKRKEC